MTKGSSKPIVAIRNRAGVVVGVGFLVGKYVLTCAHVVNLALGRDLMSKDAPPDVFRVEFSFLGSDTPPDRNMRVLNWLPPAQAGDRRGPRDIALLSFTEGEDPPRRVKPARLGTARENDRVRVYGFPASPARRDGLWCRGEVIEELANQLVQINADSDGPVRPQPGYSGSPVIDTSRRVVGMFVEVSDQPNRGADVAGSPQINAIPSEWLRDMLPSRRRPGIASIEWLREGSYWVRSGLKRQARRSASPIGRSGKVLLKGLAGFVWRRAFLWPLSILLAGGMMLVLVDETIGRFFPSDPNCVRIPLEVSSSTEKDELLGELANRYNNAKRTFDSEHQLCATVTVHAISSGTAMRALEGDWKEDPFAGGPLPPRPQVWLPSSSMWSGLLRESGRGIQPLAGPSPPITASVLGIAMPKRMADALREHYGEKVGWAEILELATNSEGWGSLGHPEWRQFALGRDNPHYSTSGLAATVATYYAAVGKGEGLKAADLDNGDVVRFVHGIESSVAHYGDEATQFMQELYDEDRKFPDPARHVPFVSAVVVQEQLTHLYNGGSPKGDVTRLGQSKRPFEPMEMIYPNDGTLKMDHPYVELAGTNEQRKAAADFRSFLLEPEQQQRFVELGFRRLDAPDRPTETLVESVAVRADQRLSFIKQPEPSLIARMQTGWDANRKRARVMLVLDKSGSMGEPIDLARPEGMKKIELLRPAAIRGLHLLDDDDEAELRTFSSNPDYSVPVRMSRVQNARARFDNVIKDMEPQGETALCNTLLAAQRDMLKRLDVERINAIILLTDGKNFPPNKAECSEVIKRVDADNLETSVRIFTISYGAEDVDEDLLRRVAQLSKASYYDATNPRDIDQVFVSVFSNFGYREGSPG